MLIKLATLWNFFHLLDGKFPWAGQTAAFNSSSARESFRRSSLKKKKEKQPLIQIFWQEPCGTPSSDSRELPNTFKGKQIQGEGPSGSQLFKGLPPLYLWSLDHFFLSCWSSLLLLLRLFKVSIWHKTSRLLRSFRNVHFYGPLKLNLSDPCWIWIQPWKRFWKI